MSFQLNWLTAVEQTIQAKRFYNAPFIRKNLHFVSHENGYVNPLLLRMIPCGQRKQF